MKNICLFILFICVMVLQDCIKDDIIVDRDNLILGNWEFKSSSEILGKEFISMKRTKFFTEKFGSMKFSSGGDFGMSQSFGFAGQLMYFAGNWSYLNDSIIEIDIDQVLPINYRIVVTRLDKTNFEYYYLYE